MALHGGSGRLALLLFVAVTACCAKVHYSPGHGCHRGRVCCRFESNTLEFKQCIEEHGCRPQCYSLPRGCCYNGAVKAWGSVVEAVEDECVNLKCAASRIDYPPYLSARLVLVKGSQSPYCEPYCVHCRRLRCVDSTGLLREEGEKFTLSCLSCKCYKGVVVCQTTNTICPPLPRPIPRYCRVTQGPCCPTLNCSVERTCRDHYNRDYDLYSTWKSDPCTTHTCTLAGITARREHCPPKPHANCIEEEEYSAKKATQDLYAENTPRPKNRSEYEREQGYGERYGERRYAQDGERYGEPRTRGGGNTDGDRYGEPRTGGNQDGEPYGELYGEPRTGGGAAQDSELYTQDGEPRTGGRGGAQGTFECCPKWRCGPDCSLVRCSYVPPGEDCVEVYEPLTCCPKWNCSGCTDTYQQYYSLGSEWQPSPCTSLTCTPLGIVNTTAPCKPKPNKMCREDRTQYACCPVYDCGGCRDNYNILRPMFSKWEDAPCSFYTCTPRGIVPAPQHCPPKPHDNCYEGPLDETCCPAWECGPDCRLVRCAGPPQTGCTPYVPPLACCPIWNCSVCVDYEGRRREAGSMWRTEDPCTNQTCAATGDVVPVSAACALPASPRHGCFSYTPDRQCCPVWNCSGCMDDDGVFYPMFQAWNSDPCTKHYCDPSGIFTQVFDCPTLPSMPHPNCVIEAPPGQCCPDWQCGPDCRLVLCSPAPQGDCTRHRPPMACCDEYTCSGCTDTTGKSHAIGHSWLSPPCDIYICRDDGIATYNMCNKYPAYPSIRRSFEVSSEEVSRPEGKEEEEEVAPKQTPTPVPASTDVPASE